jgi:hypothetical protein
MKKCSSHTCHSASRPDKPEAYGYTCRLQGSADSNWTTLPQQGRQAKKDVAIYLQPKINERDIQHYGILYKWGGTTERTPWPRILCEDYRTHGNDL